MTDHFLKCFQVGFLFSFLPFTSHAQSLFLRRLTALQTTQHPQQSQEGFSTLPTSLFFSFPTLSPSTLTNPFVTLDLSTSSPPLKEHSAPINDTTACDVRRQEEAPRHLLRGLHNSSNFSPSSLKFGLHLLYYHRRCQLSNDFDLE